MRVRDWPLLTILGMLSTLGQGCGERAAGPAGARVEASHVFSGGPILTLAGESAAEALAIGGGRILAVGDRAAVEAFRGPETVDYDLAGRALTPAFVDHHVHLLNLGLSLLNAEAPNPAFADVCGLSLADLEAEIARRAALLAPGSWLLGKGWSQGAWGESRLPSHEALSRAAPGHPVFLTRVDGHAGWVNAAGMEVAGIAAATPDPPGGAILRGAGGRPSGVLLERANELLRPHLPEPDEATVVRAFRLAAGLLAQQGVSDAFDAGFLGPPGVVDLALDLERYLELLAAADRTAPLPLRVHLMVPAPSPLADKVVRDPARYRRLSPRVGVTHLKLFADGALGSRGALLSHPYADDPATTGVERMTAEAIRAEAQRALAAELDVATHAIGDLAVRRVLDVYAGLLAGDPGLAPARLRIEHFSYARAEDFRRAADLGVVLSVNPDFVAPDDAGRTMEEARVGAERGGRVYAFGRLAGGGARLAFGSDYFARPLPPLAAFHVAVTRQNPAGLPGSGWQPEERLSRLEALRIATTLWTAGAAEPSRGRLAVGKPAELVVLSADPLTVPESEILAIRVEERFGAGPSGAVGEGG